MKKIILGLTILTSMTSFASSGTSTSVQKEKYDLKNSMKILVTQSLKKLEDADDLLKRDVLVNNDALTNNSEVRREVVKSFEDEFATCFKFHNVKKCNNRAITEVQTRGEDTLNPEELIRIERLFSIIDKAIIQAQITNSNQ